ncbi:hypothetical protein NUM3379_18850 [Kineococcus sp. NUM-3379]
MRRPPLLLAGLVAAACVLAGCGSPAPGPGAAAPAAGVGSDVSDPQAPELLRFTAGTTTGERFDASTLAGKDAVLWFWAPWCSQCRFEAPHLAAVQAAHAADVEVVGVAGLGPVEDMTGFVEELGLEGFPHVVDADGSLWQRFGVTAQPAHAFVDDSGEIEVTRGLMGAEQLEEKIAELAAR